MVASVAVDLLLEMLREDNADLDDRVVRTELAAALNGAGYPFTARAVSVEDAVAMLESLDGGVLRSAPERRDALHEGRLSPP